MDVRSSAVPDLKIIAPQIFGDLRFEVLPRSSAWPDTGTHASLLQPRSFIHVTGERQGLKIRCPEKIARRIEYIGSVALEAFAAPLLKSGHGETRMSLPAE